MDIRDMEIFLKIADYENVTRAAEDLHIAQPHVTRSLRRLEDDLGTQLFSRQKNHLHITEEGQYLKQQCRQILDLKQKTEQQIRQIQDGYSGKVYIGAIETAGTIYLPEWISGFRRLYPGVSYCLWTANSIDVLDRLRKGLLDAALIRCDYDRSSYHGIRIRQEPWVVVLSKDNPLAEKEGPLSLSDLEGKPLMVPTSRAEEVRSWFEEENLHADIVCEFSPLMNAIVLAENDLGIAILPESALEYFGSRNITARQMKKERSTQLSLVWKADAKMSKSARHFIDYVSNRSNDTRKR